VVTRVGQTDIYQIGAHTAEEEEEEEEEVTYLSYTIP
jgi:hypothetical protein